MMENEKVPTKEACKSSIPSKRPREGKSKNKTRHNESPDYGSSCNAGKRRKYSREQSNF
jgi:hypothetical protein